MGTRLLLLVALPLLLRAGAPSSTGAHQRHGQVRAGTSWVQVYAAQTAKPQAQSSDAHGAPASTAGLTGIYVAASFMSVCSTGSDGARLAVTANNICIGGSHWGAPFLRLRGGAQGFSATWRKKEVGQAKTKRQARVERGKKLTVVMGKRARRGRHRGKKQALEDQQFKSEWHKQKALKQADRRLARKMARRLANTTSALPCISQQPQGPPPASSAEALGSNVSQGDMGGDAGLNDGAEWESVPESFLEEVERTERGKSGHVASSASSGSPCVVLDSDGNEVLLDMPLEHLPGQEADGGGEDELERIGEGAALRPYTDAHGNVKWVDTRPAHVRHQHLQATQRHLGHVGNSTEGFDASKGLERLRGGRGGPEEDEEEEDEEEAAAAAAAGEGPARRLPVLSVAHEEDSRPLATYDGRGRLATGDDVQRQRAEKLVGGRLLVRARCQLASLARKVPHPLAPPLRLAVSCAPRFLPCLRPCAPWPRRAQVCAIEMLFARACRTCGCCRWVAVASPSCPFALAPWNDSRRLRLAGCCCCLLAVPGASCA